SLLLGGRHVGVAFFHFVQTRFFELVDEVISFYAEAFAAADFDVGLFRVVSGEFIAELAGTARRERDNFVRKVNRVRRGLPVTEAPQSLRHHVLQIGLARVDDVVNARRRFAEVRSGGVVPSRAGGPDRFVLGGVGRAVVGSN